MGSAAIFALLLWEPGRAERRLVASTDLRDVLEELRTFSEEVEAIGRTDKLGPRRRASQIVRRFELRLPELRRRSVDALKELDRRVVRGSQRVDRQERQVEAVLEKLRELRRSVATGVTRTAGAGDSAREQRVRAVTGLLADGFLRDRQRRAVETLAALDEDWRRNRLLGRELVESGTRLEALFQSLEKALPRAAALLAAPPPRPDLRGVLDRRPRHLVLALERIQTTLLDVMGAQVAALEAMSSGSELRSAPPSPPSKEGNLGDSRSAEEFPERLLRVRKASSLRVALPESGLEEPDAPSSALRIRTDRNHEDRKGINHD